MNHLKMFSFLNSSSDLSEVAPCRHGGDRPRTERGGNEGSNTHKAEANENNDFPTGFPSRAVASDRFQVKEKLWKDWLRCQSGVVYASFNPYVSS